MQDSSNFPMYIGMRRVFEGRWFCSPEKWGVHSSWSPNSIQLLAEIIQAGEQVVADILSQGKTITDDQGTALVRAELNGSDDLCLKFCECSYFKATVHQLGRHLEADSPLGELARSLRDKHGHCPELEDSPFPTRLGVTVALITGDNKTLVSQRSGKTAVSAATFAPSISGGIRPNRGDCDGSLPIPAKMVVRQAKEELHFDVDLINRDNLVFTCLGQDEELFGEPMLVGTLTTPLTAAEILSQAQEAEDAWETERWSVVDVTRPAIADLIQNHPTVGVSRLTWAKLWEGLPE